MEETDHFVTYRKIFLDVEKPITDANRSKGDDRSVGKSGLVWFCLVFILECTWSCTHLMPCPSDCSDQL